MNISREQGENIKNGLEQVLEEEGISLSINLKKPKYNIPDYIMLFQHIGKVIVPTLSPMSCKVLMFLMGHTDYGNYVPITVITIAEALKVKRQSISKALKELKDKHVLLSVENITDKRIKCYCVNPHVAYKGTVKERGKMIKSIPSAINQLNIFKPNSEGHA